jgi:hypothetical protein
VISRMRETLKKSSVSWNLMIRLMKPLIQEERYIMGNYQRITGRGTKSADLFCSMGLTQLNAQIPVVR